MCGFVGFYKINKNVTSPSLETLTKMRDSMIHRGPDDQGIFIPPTQEVGLAHRRLSIIDLSSEAAQPMTNNRRDLWIVFNGEIYNHREIRQELEKSGHIFLTDHSDTEVILKGYEAWGEKVLDRLRGMFAFVIWDKRKNKIWMARDRIGIKPLYYTRVNGLFLFASEIKALLEYPEVKRRCDNRAFYDFMTFLVSPAPKTLFEGIYKLPAATSMTIHSSGKIEEKRYWNPFSDVKKFENYSEADWAEKIISSLRDSIRYRMVSDVKFGVFLSGGIDSSTNVALMSELMSRPVETFSIGFKGPEKFNELHHARKIVDRYKTNHHEVIIDSDDMINFLPQLVYHQDEPIVDPVCVPVYYVSKLAKENGTTVCQVGEGADELFCGYPYWSLMLKAQPWFNGYQHVPSAMRAGLFQLMNLGMRNASRGMRPLEMVRRASYGETLFWGGAEAYQETHKSRLLHRSLKNNGHMSSFQTIDGYYQDFKNEAPEGADYLHWMSYLDLRLRLPELLLMRVDKMTMANSVESRVPFLDHEFVTLALKMSQKIKFKDRTLKYILKKAVEPLLPHDIIYRKKQGFAVPVADWFKEKTKDWSQHKIMEFSKRTEFFDPKAMEGFVQNSSSKVSWFILNFVLWYERWMEKKELDLPVSR